MKKTYVPVIYDCNDNCISCPVKRREDKENPSFESIKNEINEILNYSNHIEFNGGEPTLRKDILKILKYSAELGAKEIGLLTNSQTFFYEDFTKRISKVKGLKIITTLYGHNKRIHDSITRTPGSFDRKIKGINNLIKYDIKIELRILLHKMNYIHFDEISDFLIKNYNPNNFVKIVIMNPKLSCTAKKYVNQVKEKMSIISNVLKSPIIKLNKYKFNVELYHFPHCILPTELWHFSKGITSDGNEIIFPDYCEKCQKRSLCSGIWGSYYTHDEYNEFIPISII